MTLEPETSAKGYIFHPDPDVLVALSHGMHDYVTIDEAKQGYVDGELSQLELEAVLDGVFDRQPELLRDYSIEIS